jgi:hypothetical protein
VRRHVAVLLVVLSACAWFQAWFLGLTPRGTKLGDPKLSDAYTEALAHGQAFLLATPDPRLISAKDPFGPATAALIISDTSYFRGHFYMYFGIVPFVTFLVPLRLLIGAPPSPELTILFFLTLGYAAYGSILLLAVERWGRRCTPIFCGCAFMVIVVASGTWPLMGRPAIYEIENAAAYAFFGLSLLALTRFEWSNDRPVWLLALSSGLAGLVMGCRPNYFPAIALVASWIVYSAYTHPAPKPERLRRTLIAISPIALIGLGLASWNFVRFTDPSDFGLRHTVSMDPAKVRPLSSLANLPYHIHRYTVGLPRVDRYFPFIQGQTEGPFAIGAKQEASNQVYGFLIVTPVLLLALTFFIKKFVGNNPKRIGSLYVAAFLGNFIFLSSLTMSCYRYPSDFLGPLALVASLGFVCGLPEDRIRKRFAQLLCIISIFWSAVACTCETFSVAQTTELFDQRRQIDFQRASQFFNEITFGYESYVGAHPKFMELNVKLPKDRTGASEPLFVLGDRGAQDFVYLYYTNVHSLQVGFESMGNGGSISPPFELDYSGSHKIEIRLGSLLPPKGSPMLSGIPPNDIDIDRRILCVKIDGEIALDADVQFHPNRAQYFLGSSPWDGAFGSSFTGTIASAKFDELEGALLSVARWDRRKYGPIKFKFSTFPLPIGVKDPLLSIGTPSRGEQLLLVHLGNNRAKLEWINTEGRRLEGAGFPWRDNHLTEAKISSGSLFPPRRSSVWDGSTRTAMIDNAKTRVSVELDGVTELQDSFESSDQSPEMVRPGKDCLGREPNVMPAIAVMEGMERDFNWDRLSGTPLPEKNETTH